MKKMEKELSDISKKVDEILSKDPKIDKKIA